MNDSKPNSVPDGKRPSDPPPSGTPLLARRVTTARAISKARPAHAAGLTDLPAESPAAPPAIAFPRVSLSRRDAARDCALFTALLCAFVVVLSGTDLSWRLHELWPAGGIFFGPLMTGTLSLAMVAWLVRRRGQSWSAIGLGSAPTRVAILTGLAFVPLCYLAGGIANVVYTLASRRDIFDAATERAEFFSTFSQTSLAVVLPVSLFVGVYEEILFRGFLLGRVRTITGSTPIAVALTTVIFGSLHFSQGIMGMVQTGVVGGILAIVVVRTRSLWSAIVAHATIDALSLTAAVLLRDVLPEAIRELTSTRAVA